MADITLIMKPTLDCNLSCKYCYFSDVRTHDKMTLSTLKNLFEKLNKYHNITFIWHGGEPMLMGIDFYKRAIELQKNYEMCAKNTIQTNLTLLTPEWIPFFKDNKITVGTSLDGVREVHDLNRSGSFNKVVDGIKQLKEKEIEVGVVSIVTDLTLPYLYENFELFKSLNVSVRINPEMQSKGNLNSITIASKNYEFTNKFYYDLWIHNKPIDIEPMSGIDNCVRNACKLRGCLFSDLNCVGEFPAVLPNGNVCHCGRFTFEDVAKLGNVNDREFTFGFSNQKTEMLYDMNESRMEKCEKSCQFFCICHGGCFYHGFINGNGGDIFCEAYKKMFEHVILRNRQGF